jgi:hypothetical protein
MKLVRHDSHCLPSDRGIADARSSFCFCRVWYNDPCCGRSGGRNGNRATSQSGTAISLLTREGSVERKSACDGELPVSWLERMEIETNPPILRVLQLRARIADHTLQRAGGLRSTHMLDI